MELHDNISIENNINNKLNQGNSIGKTKNSNSFIKNIFSHIVNDYLIVNGKIKVTPHHYVYARRN